MSMTKTIFKKMGSLLTGEKMDGRRNNFFVEREFQRSFIVFFLVIAAMLVIASGMAYYFMVRGVIEESMYVIHPRFRGITDIVTSSLVMFFGEVSVIFLTIIIITADRMMRRIAKSLMTYERIADRLATLDFRGARAMETKLFPRLHGEYVDLIDKYSADIALLKEKVGRIQALIELLDGHQKMPEEKKDMAITELFELNGAVESKMAEYKLNGCF